MRKILIAIAVLLLLMIIGGATWIFFLREDPNSQEPLVVEAEKTPSAEFVMAPIIVNYIKGNKVIGRVSLEVTLEVAEGEDFLTVRRFDKRLRNSFFIQLYSLYDSRLYTLRGFDSELIHKRLEEIALAQLPKDLLRSLKIRATELIEYGRSR